MTPSGPSMPGSWRRSRYTGRRRLAEWHIARHVAFMNHLTRRLALLLFPLLFGTSSTLRAQVDEQLVRAYLWPQGTTDFERAEAALRAAPWTTAVSRADMHDLAEIMRSGPPIAPARAPTVGDSLNELVVSTVGGRSVPVWVRLPSDYTPDRQWPLMFAMHGGPPGRVEGATRGALRMIEVWAEAAETAGWIVAAPAMVDVVSRDGRTQERLPYEIFQPEEARAVLDAVRAQFSVNPDRIVSTGISLGSNFSIAYAAAHPDWFSAIVPVSTEGESREHLLRNLAPVPVYVLEGSQDRNIRGVSGPRAMNDILTALGADLVYREFGDRAHEGFAEHYPDVLRWLDSRPRVTDPKEVLRVPHAGIAGTSRRVHWVESRDRQGLVRARVTSLTEIRVTARWTGAVRLYLNDRLVDLDRAITVFVNGQGAFEGRLERSIVTALEGARKLGDERRVHPVVLEVEVPRTAASIEAGTEFWTELEPTRAQGILSFWEMYAVRALEERFESVGFRGEEVPLPRGVEPSAPEQVAIRVTEVDAGSGAAQAGLRAGDVLLDFGGEPFFRGRGGVAGLHHWLLREVRTSAQEYELQLWREGRRVTLRGDFALGPYRPPTP
jgi:predicted esterase